MSQAYYIRVTVCNNNAVSVTLRANRVGLHGGHMTSNTAKAFIYLFIPFPLVFFLGVISEMLKGLEKTRVGSKPLSA